jgi:hypothetical protein
MFGISILGGAVFCFLVLAGLLLGWLGYGRPEVFKRFEEKWRAR